MDYPLPTTLPNCDLIAVLAEKASQRNDTKFDFIGNLNAFRERISGEARQINVLFPEYTPHDEEYHLSKLFHVASLLLGRERLESMNSAELFVLAVAIYGHDWGMAVSEQEKEFITGNTLALQSTDFSLLPNEKSKFLHFLKNQGLQINQEKNKISIELWREYVRQTHAFRSAERVRKYFDKIDGGIADAASRVCEGHWLDFEEIDKYSRYPSDYSVLQETVNLRALAVYLRLIDLLDLSEDRTPYVIWKFVAPRDPRSKMEWNKHRALRPITCPPYQVGRIIKVDGSTEDHEVYAALEDLRIWCDQQLRGCNDILARMNDPRHKLDIFHIDWRVNPRGFKPILIQFEFDRGRMFDILGDEIYQSNSYVFLRELLQNSIDAIRVRREVLKRNGIKPDEIGIIRVNVDHGKNGDAVITWEDDGIGMDDYVIRNYFAVAGKSYYRSKDFEREGLNIDPISRFGIGFLSCFMVADHVQIKTFKDPYLPPFSEPLHIDIPAMYRQFRIDTEPRETAVPGTRIIVFVDGKKLLANKDDTPNHLHVTSYLSEVAGFVEFPIVIDEGELRSIIIHPNQDPTNVLKRFGKEYKIHKIDLSYPLSNEVLAQDLVKAKDLIIENSLDLSSDLGIDGYEGIFASFLPKDIVIDGSRETFPDDSSLLTLRDGAKEKIRWANEDEDLSQSTWRSMKTRTPLSRRSSRVFRDGILVSEASYTRKFSSRSGAFVPPKVTVNMLKSNRERINLARTEIIEDKEHWGDSILRAIIQKVIRLADLSELEPVERLSKLSRTYLFYGLKIEDLWENFPHEKWPIAILEKNRLRISEWGELSDGPIRKAPENIPLTDELKDKLFGRKTSVGFVRKWTGESYMIKRFSHNTIHGIMSAAQLILGYPISGSYVTSEISFLKPPFENFPPLISETIEPYVSELDLSGRKILFDKSLNQTSELTMLDIHNLRRMRRSHTSVYSNSDILSKIHLFAAGHESAFAYGFKYLNLKHPIIQILIRCIVALERAREQKSVEAEKIGKISDAFIDLSKGAKTLYGESLSSIEYEVFCENLTKVFSLARSYKILEFNPDNLKPSPEDFIKNTIREKNKKLELIVHFEATPLTFNEKKTQSFGKALKR